MADKGEGSISAGELSPQLSRYSVFEILLRLSAPDVHRCRFVSHEWESVANDGLLAANHRRTRSSMPLFLYRAESGPLRVDGDHVHRSNLNAMEGTHVYPTDLNAVDLATGKSRSLLRSVDVIQAAPYELSESEEQQEDLEEHQASQMLLVENQVYRVHGTCDGILLLSMGPQLVAYNPFTRRWGHLPPLHNVNIGGIPTDQLANGVLGFYASGPLGGRREHRILHQTGHSPDVCYHIHILGGQVRDIVHSTPETSQQLRSRLKNGLPLRAYMDPPIMLRDTLYWLPFYSENHYRMIVFDTRSEQFRCISTPFDNLIPKDAWEAFQLLNVQDELVMAVTNLNDSGNPNAWPRSVINLWVLGDNDGNSWHLRHTITEPPASLIQNFGYVANVYPPVILMSGAQGLFLPCPRYLVQCDDRWSVLTRRHRGLHWVIGLPQQIDESFVLHDYLDNSSDEPPFNFLGPPSTGSESANGNSEDSSYEDNDDSSENYSSEDNDGNSDDNGSSSDDDDDDGDFSGREDVESLEEGKDSCEGGSGGSSDAKGEEGEDYGEEKDEDQPPSKRQK